MISKQALLAGLLLLAVYVAGAISGVALTRIGPAGRGPGLPALPPGAVGFPQPATSPGEGAFPDQGFFANMLARRLDLPPEQEEQVRQVLQVHRQNLDSILAGIRPSMEQQFSDMDAAIRALLTEDQAKDFDAFVNEQFARLGGRSPLGPRRGSRPEFRRRP
jgi:uncharacterized membrane protein